MTMRQSHQDMLDAYRDRWNRRFTRNKVFFVLFALLLVVAGVLTFMYPLDIYVVIQAVVAAALIVHGVTQIGSYVGSVGLFKDPMLLVTGILNVLLGIVLIMLPSLFTATTLSFIMGIMLIVIGAERVSHASHMRYFNMPGSGAGTVSGVLNIVLGVVFLLMPLVSSVMLSLMVSAYLVVTGVTLLIEALAMKRLEE